MKAKHVLMLAAVVVAFALAAIWWRSQQQGAVAPTQIASGSVPPASAPAAVPSPPVTHVIEPPTTAAPMTTADIEPALVELLGRKAVSLFLQTDSFVQGFVATVDNLGRQHAPASKWPVQPTTGRFTVQIQDSETAIAADNSRRYTPFVQLVESVDTGRAVDLYVRLYPLLQQAYEELGYPKRNFNDRLIEVIDQLLATPDAAEPVAVVLTEVKGPIPSTRPWVRYQYADPALESLSAGQKILLRMGAVNERRLKAKLADVRRGLMRRSTTR
ncbi:DUF3014 domain-containing protein [Ramlibacter solisilvae]|uniref:DUF3014 domain-containing protein n=1 Tax=Ramlibacter tataouinensis TaxID=94132 RepID=A0A127JT13_9BURK|nr:DUF3014 domain-containing protein [Ramlibacter tataouinensis]AMO23013.1 hypothetical protein UC35_09075 [Ramlibacter tataouinensis]